MEQLGNLDSLFVSLETSDAPQHVGCLSIYAPALSGNTLTLVRQLGQILDLGIHMLDRLIENDIDCGAAFMFLAGGPGDLFTKDIARIRRCSVDCRLN